MTKQRIESVIMASSVTSLAMQIESIITPGWRIAIIAPIVAGSANQIYSAIVVLEEEMPHE